MGRYAYVGTSDAGVEVRGDVDAPGLLDASVQLRAKGISLLSLEAAEAVPEARPATDLDAFAMFNRSLGEIFRSGMPLPEGIREIAKGLRRGRFRAGLEKVEGLLREGRPLHEAVETCFPEFPPYYGWALRAGGASGANLSGILLAVAANAERVRRARQALIGALIYPVMVLGFAACLFVMMLTVFLPAYRDLHIQFKLHNSPTIVDAAGTFWSVGIQLGLVIGAAILLIGGYQVLRRSAAGERLLFRIPLIGRILGNLCLSRMFGVFGVLLKNRTRLPDALPLALGVSGSLQLTGQIDRLTRQASEGAGLADVLRNAPAVPSAVAAYLAVAERTARIPEAAAELADHFAGRVVSESESLFLWLFPASIVAVGAVMASIFMTVVLPYARLLERMAGG